MYVSMTLHYNARYYIAPRYSIYSLHYITCVYSIWHYCCIVFTVLDLALLRKKRLKTYSIPNQPLKDEAQTVLFKDPARTAL